MSKFRKFHNFIIELGQSIQEWKDEFKGHLVTAGWRVVGEGNDPYFIDVLPPAAELVGNDVGYEVTRFSFTGTTTQMATYTVGINASSSAVYVIGFNIYNYENAIDINGVRISNGGTPGMDYYFQPGGRATNFYNVLRQYITDHPDSDLAKLKFTLITDPNNAGRGDIVVEGGGGVSPTFANSANIPVTQTSGNYTPGTPAAFSEVLSLTHDLASGFVYYLSIHDRKIELATKTTAAFFGPVGVQYVENAAALAATPAGLTPIEAVTYGIGNNLSGNHGTRFSHVWGIAMSNNWGGYNGRHAELYSGKAYFDGLPMKDRRVSDNAGRAEASGLGVHPGVIPYVFPAGVNVVSLAVRPVITYDQSSNQGLSFVSPGLPMPDVFCAVADSTNESLHLARVVTDATPLVGITAGGVELQNAANFPDAGVAVIEGELVKYTGKAGNTLTGVTRAAYATAEVAHGAGVAVYPALWFVKINGGMMTAGYTKPGEVA